MKRYRRKQNEGISALRQKLGLTQGELADILMITRSALGMNELGQRTLPGKALMKIAMLEINLAKSIDFQRRGATTHPSELRIHKELNEVADQSLARETACWKKADTLKTQLATITNAYTRTRHWLDLIERSLEQEKFTLQDEGEWWTRQKYMALSKLSECDRPVQRLLQHKINLLIGEARLQREARLALEGS